MICQTVVYVRHFTRADWPTAADGTRAFADTFTDAAAAVAGWWLDPACTSLFACAVMPPTHYHGGLPQRCTELDVRPAIVARLEAAAPTSSDTLPLRVTHTVASGGRLLVSVAACDEIRLYLKDGPGGDAAVLSYRSSAELFLAFADLAPSRDDDAGAAKAGAAKVAPSAPRAIWAYRACGPLGAPTELRRSAPIELAPLLLAANELHAAAAPAAAAPAVAAPAAALPGAERAPHHHHHRHHDGDPRPEGGWENYDP